MMTRVAREALARDQPAPQIFRLARLAGIARLTGRLDRSPALNRVPLSGFHWGIRFQSPQYLALFTRWFDDLWASIPDSYPIYWRNGFNHSAIDRIRRELQTTESAQARQIA
jgi:hypothetical protein